MRQGKENLSVMVLRGRRDESNEVEKMRRESGGMKVYDERVRNAA